MARAGRVVLDCTRRLARQGDNAVSPLLSGQGSFYEWNHYPAGDVYDPETHAQYYYHAHPPSDPAAARGQRAEHGHFHTFLRPLGMPARDAPGPPGEQSAPAEDNETLCHLIAVAVDAAGEPLRLFTTNRWVTGETWCPAADVTAMLPRFAVRHERPSAATNRWLGALIRLYRPDILSLLRARDRRLAAWAHRHGLDAAAVLEDRRFEVVAEQRVSVAARLAELTRLLDSTGS